MSSKSSSSSSSSGRQRPPPSSLSSLPADVLKLLLKRMDCGELLAFTQTSKANYSSATALSAKDKAFRRRMQKCSQRALADRFAAKTKEVKKDIQLAKKMLEPELDIMDDWERNGGSWALSFTTFIKNEHNMAKDAIEAYNADVDEEDQLAWPIPPHKLAMLRFLAAIGYSGAD